MWHRNVQLLRNKINKKVLESIYCTVLFPHLHPSSSRIKLFFSSPKSEAQWEIPLLLNQYCGTFLITQICPCFFNNVIKMPREYTFPYIIADKSVISVSY